MTTKFGYGAEGIEYCRTGRSLPSSLSRPGEPARVYPIGNRINSQNSINDFGDDKDKGRRRIAVACSRCRKRKIKCSGDIGGGQGCLNCKNAGSDPATCLFLRVSSAQIDSSSLPLSPAAYRYSLSHLNVVPAVNPGPAGSLNAHQTPEPAASMPRGQVSQYSMSGACSTPIPGSELYAYSGSEGPFASYPLHNSPQEVTSSSAMYTNNDQLRQWMPPVLQPVRGGAAVYEENANNRTVHGLPYLPTASPATEGQSMFPGMSAMAQSLPNSASGGERVLPTPRSNYFPSNASDLSILASQTYNTDNSLPMKTDNNTSWVDRSDNLSTHTRTEQTITTSRPSITRLESQDGSGSGGTYMTTQQLPTISPPQQQQSDTASASAEYSLAAATNAVSASSDEHILSSTGYGNSSYAYSLPSSARRSSTSEGATLLSGQTYHHLPHRPAPDLLTRHQHYLGLHVRGAGGNEIKNTSSSSRAQIGGVGTSYS